MINSRVKKIQITIEIKDEDTDEVLWSDWHGGTWADDFKGAFESTEMSLGSMERNLKRVLERDYPENEDEESEENKTEEEKANEAFAKQYPDSKVSNAGENNEYEEIGSHVEDHSK